jgi:hypothetical protein
MKKIAKFRDASVDDIYYVSAADVADKIIDRMRRGLDPLLLSSSSLARISVSSVLRTRSLTKFD